MRLDQVNIKEKFYLNYLEIYRVLQTLHKLNGVAHVVKIVAIKAFKSQLFKRSFRNQLPVWQGGDFGMPGYRRQSPISFTGLLQFSCAGARIAAFAKFWSFPQCALFVW
ncbi:hypothetical protein KDX30_05885 [Pseudomonas sp. CDFA 553]|uniref:hypothetical protein n=1 Tax=Pseudomonas quasicaspiana TaxID=2829821 RepID=UPI001E5089D4|nr:hypothetical protein [Pseudomonas quasicaspiana]MCD5987428.1 hypothetical protein [Pseudomonas quasicaspiana]